MKRIFAVLLHLDYLVFAATAIPCTVLAAESERMDTPESVLLPAPVAWVEGPRSLDANPAGLGFRTRFGAEMAVTSARPDSDLVGLGGYLGAFGFAAGGRVVFTNTGTDAHAAFGFGHSPVEGLSVGVGLRLHAPGGTPETYGAFDLGLALRPTSWLCVAGGVRDLAKIEGHPERYSPVVVAGLGLRPFGRRLSLAFDWRYETAVDDAPFHYQVAAMVEPIDGLRVFGTIDEHAAIGAGVSLVFRSGWLGGQGRVATRDGARFSGWTAAVGVSADQRPTRLVPRRSLAEVQIGTFTENPTPFPLGLGRTPRSFADLVSTLRSLESDRSVTAVLLRLDGYGGGLARAEEIRTEIARLRTAGKPVYAYLESGGGNVDYYIASACDRIWAHPGGTLSLTGLSSRLTFYRGSLDKLGIEAQFSRIGMYKSSPERFTETGPTAPNLRVRNALLDDRFDRWLSALADGRGTDPESMRALVDDGPYPADLALDRGLLDGLFYADEVRDQAREQAGKPKLAVREPLKEERAAVHWRAPYTVAVIHVDGLINTGKSGRLPFGLLEITGSDTTVDAIRRAREDRAVQAIVLRVNSPGGSAFASEEIWREVHRTRGEKPIVVSMGSMAASGGYFVSCATDRIVANPSTLTGSIGVYAGKVSLAGLYDMIGITSYRLRRGEHSGLYDLAEPWSPSEYRAIERIVDHLYADFVEHVREGRGMGDASAVDEVARGRVWTGSQALDVGLVDEMGGLLRAVEVARELASIPPRADVRLSHRPRVSWWPSIELGKGFVVEPELPIPEELRATLSTLALIELQRERAAALMMMPGWEVVE